MKNERRIFKLVSRKEDVGNTGIHLYKSSRPKEKIMNGIHLALFVCFLIKKGGETPRTLCCYLEFLGQDFHELKRSYMIFAEYLK